MMSKPRYFEMVIIAENYEGACSFGRCEQSTVCSVLDSVYKPNGGHFLTTQRWFCLKHAPQQVRAAGWTRDVTVEK